MKIDRRVEGGSLAGLLAGRGRERRKEEASVSEGREV